VNAFQPSLHREHSMKSNGAQYIYCFRVKGLYGTFKWNSISWCHRCITIV